MVNRLIREKSPYLLQHAENPVDWYPWGPEAFEAARLEDKPVFLSIGYSSCHWCHVMAHESFEDNEVGRILNRDFLSVKVDREERPDVDAVYMEACIAQNGSGGWPLTVLLTPEQKPFWTGTYLPKEALCRLLRQVSRLWRQNREALLEAGDQLTKLLGQQEQSRPQQPEKNLLDKAAAQFAAAYDARWGGFGAAPKFPTPHNLLFLLRYGRETGRREPTDMAAGTLNAMYKGGLFDHIGGGFCRYSTDRMWLVPHFEKMLYDNALLAMAYLEGARITGQTVYREIACRTLDYVLRELTDSEGAFCCSQDADSDGEEGKYYLLTPKDLSEALTPEEAALFAARYHITEEGSFGGKSIPNLIGTQDWQQEPEGMEAIREKLRAFRKERTRLHRDDKVLAAWNGLMIAAMAEGEPRHRAAAVRAAEFLRSHMTAPDGRLWARWREGEAAHPGKLEDYAFCCWGMLALYRATLKAAYLEKSLRWAEVLLRHFSAADGGFYPYADDGEQLIARNREVYDGALPSGNAAAALVLVRLAALTEKESWQQAAERQLRYLAGRMQDYPAGHSFSLLAMMEAFSPSARLLCVTAEPELPRELEALLKQHPQQLTILLKTPENAALLAELAPFTAHCPLPETGSRYYLCQGRTCRPPVSSLKELEPLLHQPAAN